MTLLDDLWRLWKAYVDFSVVGNHELKEILFHVFLGIILTDRGYHYVEGAKKKTTRIHIFMIQDSGTGKSQLMKALHEIVDFLGIKSRITVKDNEASMTGTVYRNPMNNTVHVKKGMLSELILLCWDEGSILLKHSAFMDIITDVFQVVMDEPGRVSKGMKLGKIEYPCKTTVVAGSYMFDAFRETLISKGFLQRMYLHYKDFTEKEKRDIDIGVNLMKAKTDLAKYDRLKLALKTVVDRIPDSGDKTISFNIADMNRFNRVLVDIRDEHVTGAFVGEKQKVLETFYSRLHLLIDKIATQKAMVEGKAEVTMEDMMYGRKQIENHLQSLLRIFDFLAGGKITTTEDERQNLVIGILKRNKGKMVQSSLLDELKKLKNIGKWDLGFNRSHNLINKMIENRKLHVEKTGRNTKIIILPGFSSS